MLTKKDYKMLASIIARRPSSSFLDYDEARKDIAANLATWLKTDNPKFDQVRFFRACEV